MKKLVTTTVVVLATVSLFIACSSPSNSESPSQDVNALAKAKLVGSHQGVDAYCSGGSEDEATKETVVYKTLTFNEDGSYVSEIKKPEQESIKSTGSYTIVGDQLTLTSPEQVVTVSYTLEGDQLTLNLGLTEENKCPKGQDLLVKYLRIQGEFPTPPTPPTTPTEPEQPENPEQPGQPAPLEP